MSMHSDFVKSQIAFHEAMVEKFKASPRRRDKHLETVGALTALLDYLQELEIRPSAATSVQGGKPVQLALTFEEIQDLPPELLQELSVSEGDRMDFTILKTVEAAGGVASLDRILVGLYKDAGEIMKRATLTSRIYRMSQKGLIFAVPGKKGAYSLEELTEEQSNNLFSK